MVDIQQILKSVGEKSSEYSQGVIKFISDYGLNIDTFQSKIITLIILLSFAYVIAKFVTKPIKWAIIICIIILSISIFMTIV